MERFQSLVPLLHDKLETGCENADFESLVDFLRKLVVREETSKPVAAAVQAEYTESRQEIEKLEAMKRDLEAMLRNQRERYDREEQRLNAELEQMRRRKAAMVDDYERLYEKYQQVQEAE